MDLSIIAIPRDELDAIAERYADDVAAALLDTLAEGFGAAPDAMTAAGWLDAFRRNPRLPAPADLSSLRTLWGRRVTALADRIRSVYGRSVLAVRDQAIPAVAEPPDWRDRIGEGMSAAPDWRTLVSEGMPVVPPAAADPIMDVVWRNLSTLGDEMFDDVAEQIQEGARLGEDVEAVALRVQRVVGNASWRAKRIARTEMTRAANNASLAEMLFSGLNGDKRWVANDDNRVRPAHHEADGQQVPLAETFDVGGFPLLYPGDPNGPPGQTINCRCDLEHVVPVEQTPDWAANLGAGPMSPRAGEWPPDTLEEWMTDPVPDNPAFLPFEELTAAGEDFQSGMPPKLKAYWLAGEGAAKIRWGTPGSFDRCVRELGPKFPGNPQGLCANLYHEATGRWPGAGRGEKSLAAAADVHTGAMVALVPSLSEAVRLSVPDGEPAHQLHLTLMYLGDAVDYSPDVHDSIVERLEMHSFEGPITADAFSVNMFNPGDATDRDPCIVMGFSGRELSDVHTFVTDAMLNGLEIEPPEQHEPWIPHVTLAYTDDMTRVPEFADRVGPVTFDHILVAFGEDHYYIPLGAPVPDVAQEVLPSVPEAEPMLWPEGSFEAIITVEGIETGDSRAFLPDSLTVAPGPWLEFNWQPRIKEGHDDAVLVGRLDEVWRADGGLIMARGCFDVNGEHGREAMRLVREQFLKGVSVDLDTAVAEQFYDDPNSDEATFTLYHRARIRGATLVTYPAYVETQIWMTEGTPMEAASYRDMELVASGEPVALTAAAVESHDTPTTDAAWDGAAAVKRLPSPMSLETARNAFAWIDDSAVTDGEVPKSACKFPHHEVSADGMPGAANLVACSAGIAVLNGGRGGADIPDADVQGVYDHLARHLKDADKEAPPLTASLTACGCADTYEPPPDEMFENPKFTTFTPITITADGRILGHAAEWGTCHTGVQNTCRKPPREGGEHAYFRLGEVITASGASIPVGHITMGIGHAPTTAGFSAAAAIEHYDNTNAVVADVVSGEDAHGIWFSGRLRPNVTEAQKAALRSAQLSGDWRSFGGRLRLVAMLAVNVPGFPVPRLSTASVSGRQFALVAAGIPDNDRSARSVVMSSLQRRIGRDNASRLRLLIRRVHGEG